MDFKIDYIIETAKTIKEDKKTLGDNELYEKHKEFSDKYPKIWMAIKDDMFDERMLKSMTKVYNKTYTSASGDHIDKRTKSDIAVGNLLGNRYIYKDGVQPDSQSMQNAYDKIMKKAQMSKKK